MEFFLYFFLESFVLTQSRANIIGWQVISAKSGQRVGGDVDGCSVPVLDMSTKSEIYRRNLPLGLPRSIRRLEYECEHAGPLVQTKDETLKIFCSPVKKTGLLGTRDGSLRKSYRIIKDGLPPPRDTEFDPRRLTAVDPDYLRKSLGSDTLCWSVQTINPQSFLLTWTS